MIGRENEKQIDIRGERTLERERLWEKEHLSSIGNMEPGDVKIKFVRSFQFQVNDMLQPSVFRLSSKHNDL